MKRCGANFARLSHLALPEEYLDFLDEKGIMTFEEVGLWGKDEMVDPDHPLPKEMLQRMIEEKFNHPCIAGWSVGNEIGDEEKNPKVKAYVQTAVKMAKESDPHRLSVYASNTAQKSPDDATMYGDIAMVNVYGGWGNGAAQAFKNHNKPVFISEFGDALNSEDPNLGIIPVEKMMNQLRNKEYVLGSSLWTLNDYRSIYHGQQGWITPPSQNRSWGIVTTFRDKKRAFYAVQREYSPVKSMQFTNFDPQKDSVIITITPRQKLDIPSNVLRGYNVLLSTFNDHNKVVDNSATPLQDIYPGDFPFTIAAAWPKKEGVNVLKLELKDPQGYSVYEETLFLNAPLQPKITHTITANNAVRLQFEPSSDASEYFVKYTKGDTVYTSEKTINAHIDIEDPKIKQGQLWKYQVVAINNYGESIPSEAIELMKDEGELPPVIRGVKRTGEEVFVGYSVNYYDYLYEVEMGTQPGVYSNKLSTRVKGVLNLKSLTKNSPLYFRMRVIKQWGYPSKWTQEIKI